MKKRVIFAILAILGALVYMNYFDPGKNVKPSEILANPSLYFNKDKITLTGVVDFVGNCELDNTCSGKLVIKDKNSESSIFVTSNFKKILCVKSDDSPTDCDKLKFGKKYILGGFVHKNKDEIFFELTHESNLFHL